MTYTQIEVEVARLLAPGRRPYPPHAKVVFAAFMQQTSGLAVREHCPYCDGLLAVTEHGLSAWTVSCPCGRSHDTLKGL